MVLMLGAEKTNNTRYCSCCQAVLICLEAEHIPETTKKTLLSVTEVTGPCAGEGSWENDIAEKAGFEVSLGSRQDTSKTRRGKMAQSG